MNNGSPFNQRGGFSPLPRMNNCAVFRSPSPRPVYGGNSNYVSIRSPSSFQQQSPFSSPLYNSSPYSTHHNAQPKQRFCSPNAEQHSMYDSRSFNSSQSSNSFHSERSFDGTFATPLNHNSNRVNCRSVSEGVKNSSFSPQNNWSSAKSSPTNLDFRSQKLPQHDYYKAIPSKVSQNRRVSYDGTPSQSDMKSRNNSKWGTSTNFKSSVKASSNQPLGSDEGMGRRLFQSPSSNESNPGHSPDIRQYVHPSMLEDPWKELMEKLEEKDKI